MHFNGQEMKRVRSLRGISRRTCGARIGRSPDSVLSYELGRRQPSLPIIGAIAETLGIPLEALIVPSDQAVAA